VRILDIATLLLLAALWSGSQYFKVLDFICHCEGGAVFPEDIVFALRRAPIRRHRNLIPLVVVGCINSAVPFSLLAFASVSLPAGLTSILNATAPLALSRFSASVWLKEKLTATRMIGFVLGFVVILVGWKVIAATPTFFLAVSAGLFAALMYAIAAPYIKQNLVGVPSLVVTTGSQLSAAFLLLPALPFTVPQHIPPIAVVVAVFALAMLSTAFAYILYFRLIQKIGSTTACSLFN